MKPSDPDKLRRYVEFLRPFIGEKEANFDTSCPEEYLLLIVEVESAGFIEFNNIRKNSKPPFVPNLISGVKINQEGEKLVYEFDHPPFDYKRWTFVTGFSLGVLSLIGWILVEYIL